LSIGAAGAAAVLAAGGCGSGSGSGSGGAGTTAARTAQGDPVARAVAVTSGQKGGIAFAMTAAVDVGGTRVPLSGTGTVDRGGGRGTVRVVFGDGADRVVADELIDGRDAYLRSDVLTGKLPDGKTWVRTSLDRASDLGPGGFTSLGPSQDPAQFLDYLRGTSGRPGRLGAEDVRGTRTTRYNVLIDPQRALARTATPAARATLKRVFATLRSRTIPADVYVDDHDLVRREHMGFAIDDRGRRLSMELTIDFTGFGVPVRLDLPPAGDTVDARRRNG
jgi:hypothetical protein